MIAIRKYIVLIIYSLAFIFNANAQDGIDKLKPGELKSFGKNAVAMGDYYSAATYYDRYCQLKPKDYKIAFKLAECYRLSKDYRKAEDAYLRAYTMKPDKNALALFHYATMLKTNGNYEKADEYYAKFKKEYKGDDKSEYLKLIKNNAKAAEFSKGVIKAPLKIAIEHLDASINTSHVEASPVYLNDSTIIYGSLKTDMTFFNFNPEDSSSNEPYRKLYTAIKNDDKWKDAGELSGPFNVPDFHTTNGVFSGDGKRFYFTRCKRNNKNKIICAIYVSNNENGEWQTPVPIKEVNDGSYTSTQPAVGVESKKNTEVIYFVSDRTGGRGGLDIWYTVYDPKKKVYKAPSNAGSKLNTAGDDITPYYDLETRTLYFSSEGWQGLGGLDVFKTNGELKTWSTPANVGYPVNTGFDEMYYVLNKTDKEQGFLVSNRSSGDTSTNKTACCDDIFSFHYLESVRLNVKGKLYEERDSINDTVPLGKANVFLEMMNDDDTTYVPVNNVLSDENGNYKMEVVPGKNYRLSIKREGYLISSKDFTTKDKKTSGHVTADITTRRIPENAIALKNIYYDYGKATLTEAAKTSIDTTLLLILNNNPELAIEMASHTDNIGKDEANLTLSQHRAESVVNYLEAKGIDKKRLRAKGYGETQPIAPNQNPDGSDNPENRQMNRRTEFKVIGKVRNDGSVREEKTF